MTTRKEKNLQGQATIQESRAAQQDPQDVTLWQEPFTHVLLIIITGFVLYFNSTTAQFVFDDYLCIINNPAVKSFSCFPDTQQVMNFSIFQDVKNNFLLRPVSYYTFAINYALHDLDVFGYHLVNMLLHIGCAILVYHLLSRLLLVVAEAGACSKQSSAVGVPENAGYIPLFAGLIFISHPIQTQAVTYIVQRFVPLATLFYLSALALYVQFRTSPPKSGLIFYILSIIAAILAMESKEIAFTLPVMITLLEFIFFKGDIRPRLARLIPYLLTLAIIPVKLLQLSSPGHARNVSNAINLINFAKISSWDYLMTQFGVIVTYLRLLLLPVRQNLDYDYPLQQHFFTMEVMLPLALLLILLGFGFYLLIRSRENPFCKIVAYGILWFFITLSVESSVVPIEDLIFEHRAYLPSIGFWISLLTGCALLFNRFTGLTLAGSKSGTAILGLIVVCLSVATIERNRIWQTGVSVWSDVVRKSPNKTRGHMELGGALLQNARIIPDNPGADAGETKREKLLQDAATSLGKALQIKPDLFMAHIRLAEVFILRKQFDKALDSLSAASRIQPGTSLPYVMRGEIFEAAGNHARARHEYLEAARMEPHAHLSHLHLSDIYAKEGDIQNAIKELEFVMLVYADESVRKKLDNLRKKTGST